MPYYIQLGLHLGDDMILKGINIEINTTDVPSSSDLVKQLAVSILSSLELNKDDLAVQDLLNSLGIKRSTNEDEPNT